MHAWNNLTSVLYSSILTLVKVDRKCKNKLSSNEGFGLSNQGSLFAFFIILPNNFEKRIENRLSLRSPSFCNSKNRRYLKLGKINRNKSAAFVWPFGPANWCVAGGTARPSNRWRERRRERGRWEARIERVHAAGRRATSREILEYLTIFGYLPSVCARTTSSPAHTLFYTFV